MVLPVQQCLEAIIDRGRQPESGHILRNLDLDDHRSHSRAQGASAIWVQLPHTRMEMLTWHRRNRYNRASIHRHEDAMRGTGFRWQTTGRCFHVNPVVPQPGRNLNGCHICTKCLCSNICGLIRRCSCLDSEYCSDYWQTCEEEPAHEARRGTHENKPNEGKHKVYVLWHRYSRCD